MINYKFEEFEEKRKQQMRELNKDYVTDLKKAIEENRVAEYFDSFGFKPRFLELIELLNFYPDGEQILYNLYDYIVINIKNINLSSAIMKLNCLKSIQPLIARDFYILMEKAFEEKLFSNNAKNFVEGMLLSEEGHMLVKENLTTILENDYPSSIFFTLDSFKDKDYYDGMMQNNFEDWISLSEKMGTIEFLNYMLNSKKDYAINYIKNNFNTLLNSVSESETYEFLEIILTHQPLKNLGKEKLSLILKNSSISDIELILYNLDEKYELGIEKDFNLLNLLKEKLSKENRSHFAISAIVKSDKNDYIKEIIENLMEEEETKDFISLGDYNWSNIVFKIGEKVLKIGWIRNNPNCPSHHRIIEPEYFEIIYNENKDPVLYLEVQPYLSQEGIEKEDIEELYKDFKDDNLIYIDPKGKDPCNFGFIEKENNKKLVLIDRDGVWNKDDPNIKRMSRY